MTIKLKVAVDEGYASIVEISLPDELDPGAIITGYIKVKNTGIVEDALRVLITTLWDGGKFGASTSVPVGSVFTANIPEALGVVMPDQEAQIQIDGQHDEAGIWVTDETQTH